MGAAASLTIARAGLVGFLAAAALWLVPPAAGAVAAESKDDEIVIVVSADNPVREIPRLHLADIYLGRTSRFPDDQPALPIDQEPDSPVRERFYQTFLGRSHAEVKAHWSKIIFTGRGRPPRDVPTGADVKRAVAGDAKAIGYIERRLVDESVRVVLVE
jgi:ABC-type phosphate transport system substrate-binding protein